MAMTYGKSGLDNKFYDIFIRKSGVSGTTIPTSISAWEVGTDVDDKYYESWTVATEMEAGKWCRIGTNEANPTITTTDGDTVELNTQDTVTLSKAVEIAFNFLNLTADNFNETQELSVYTDDVDVMFVERADSGDTVSGFIANSINLSVNFEIAKLKKALFKATKAHSRKQYGFSLVAVTYA